MKFNLKEIFNPQKPQKPPTAKMVWITHYILLGIVPFQAIAYFLLFELKIIKIEIQNEPADAYIFGIILSVICIIVGLIALLVGKYSKIPRGKLEKFLYKNMDEKTYRLTSIFSSVMICDMFFEIAGLQGLIIGFGNAPSYISYALIFTSFIFISFNTLIIKKMMESLEEKG